jgi:dipeptidyl aminopeptidase/acylaminoacyl peptidase
MIQGYQMRSVFAAVLLLISASGVAQDTVPTTVQPKAAPIPLNAETFAATPFMERPSLSPNGRFVAARVSTPRGQSLVILSIVDKSVPFVGLNLDGSKVDVDSWRWVNDDWLVLSLSATDDFQGEKIRVRRLASVERSTGKITLLARRAAGQDAGNIIWIARDGSPRILLGVQNSIFLDEKFWPEVNEVDVSTGKMKVVVPSRAGILDYYADGNGVVRLGYGYDREKRIARLIYRSNEKESFKTLDRANFAKEERLSFPQLFLSEPDKAITVANSNGYKALYELDLKTLTLGAKIYGVNGYDIDGIIPNATRDGLIGAAVTEDRLRHQWFDPEFAKLQAEFDKSVGVGRARITSMSADQKRMIVQIGGPDQAGAFYLFDRDGNGALSRFAYIDEKLKLTKFAPVTTISYKARDGLTIPAVLTLPKSTSPKNLPLIVLPHGGPDARDSESWDWWVQFLAAKGYAVVQPNYRGSTGFGTVHNDLGDRQWGGTMQDDLNDAITHLAKEGIADPKRVCMVGASYGGYAAMRAAQRDGKLFRCAISFAGVSDLGALAKFDRNSLFGKEAASYLKGKAPDFESVSPLRAPEQFSTPILLVHGKNDLRVPVEQSRKMAAKLKEAGKDHRYVEQPLGDHHFSRQEDRLQFLQEMEGFLAKHNPAN